VPKKLHKVEDFSGGTNGLADPQNLVDNELAQCSGFKAEKGEVFVLGDMKAAYTLGSGDTAASGSDLDIESGYGLFTFSHDYDMNSSGTTAALNPTNYFVMLAVSSGDKHNRFDIYDDVLHTWRTDKIDLGGSLSNARMTSIKPCFFFVDGTLRISPGNFAKVASGTVLNSDTVDADTNIGDIDQLNAATASTYIQDGDLLDIDGIECIAGYTSGTWTQAFKNVTGYFPGTSLADDSTIYLMPDTRWRGVVHRKNFQAITTIGTFTEWYSTFMHPRAPLQKIAFDLPGEVSSFMSIWKNTSTNNALDNEVPLVHVGVKYSVANSDSTWNGIAIDFYLTALYDDVKQESQPRLISTSSSTVPSGAELGVWIGVEYNDDGSSYELNKRVTGARLYYKEVDTDDSSLYQLIEVDFANGCKKAEEEDYTQWVRWANAEGGSDDDKAVGCPASAGAQQTNRSGSNAFIFAIPPKSFTYEINTGYGADVVTHARFKTAVVANRRTYVGNVYQNGVAHGDRMIKSPPNKFDLLPSTNFIDVAVGDGDEIVKLETFADRLLQFKKRSLYIINIGGEVEFLESQHANMGVENPSQTCLTEFGVAWVNAFGAYLYDGQGITELTRGKLKAVDTTDRARALNVIESNIPLIGYHPSNKWLVIHIVSDVGTAFDAQAWIYDFKNGSWTWSQEFTADADKKTNMINTHDNELVFAAGTDAETPDFFKLQSATNDPAATKLFLLTKDFTLEIPSVKKNVYSVFVTYSVGGDTNIEADLIYRHSTGETTVAMQEASGSTYYDDSVGFKSTSSKKATVELVPASAITNANSFQFKISNPDGVHDVSDDFRLYNISFRYRTKGVH